MEAQPLLEFFYIFNHIINIYIRQMWIKKRTDSLEKGGVNDYIRLLFVARMSRRMRWQTPGRQSMQLLALAWMPL